MEALVIITVLAVAFWFGLRNSAGNAKVRRARALDEAEARSVALLEEFPGATDGEIATLIRDEYENARTMTPERREAASAETVGRVRRTLVLAAKRGLDDLARKKRKKRS